MGSCRLAWNWLPIGPSPSECPDGWLWQTGKSSAPFASGFVADPGVERRAYELFLHGLMENGILWIGAGNGTRIWRVFTCHYVGIARIYAFCESSKLS